MAIEKNNFKVSRFDSEFFVRSRSKESMLSEEDDRSPMESEDDDEFDDADSGAGSDDFDLLELGETGSEFCQIGDQTCCIPYELYDLPDLREILSLDVWNECLTEEERFDLTQYLPDMDQETFMHTLKDLFEGDNFHFGSPVTALFEMLKGGLCEPRVALYRRGLNFFQRHQHYHFLRNYQNSMVSKLLEIKGAWQNCKTYSVDEKIRVLNIERNRKSYMGEKLYLQTDSSSEDSFGNLRVRKANGRSFDSRGRSLEMEPSDYGRKNHRGVLKLGSSKVREKASLKPSLRMMDQVDFDGDVGRSGSSSKQGKKRKVLRDYEEDYGVNLNVNQLSDIKVLTAKPWNARNSYDYGKKGKRLDPAYEDQISSRVFTNGDYDELSYDKWNVRGSDRFYDSRKRQIPLQNGGLRGNSSRGNRFVSKGEETESDSSDQFDEEDDINPLMLRKPSLPPVRSYRDDDETVKKGRTENFQTKKKPPKKFSKNGKIALAEDDADFFEDDPDTTMIQCSSAGKKRKKPARSTPADLQDNEPLEESIPSRKRAKKKAEAENLDLEMPPPETPAAKPKKFALITPTVHKGFSFSVVHLLSSVRVAMVTPNATSDNPEVEDLDMNKTAPSEQTSTPSLTVQQIVDFVRSSPLDPSILETQEPLQDLVRGVLKIFSSRSAPLGAKGWKPLVCYQKSRKSWSWVGPTDQPLSETPVTSPEAWGLPQKTLAKLVDSFANWLKSSQETLQKIGSLPAPPIELTENTQDEKERFRDLRAQKSLTTINPSSEQVRAYFRKEEHLRYSVPDRAFSYTAADGKKSIVAPLRRCGGKPTSKARDHFMLKRDRPPHVTILCLVRDAASRLPGSIGTRADVCTLIRDSQYVVEDVTDAQVNQIVSGALDRLHYERDPCVQYDGERKLWVYLHRDREEEDFEDDGTSSTKKWRRQKKEGTEVAAGCGGDQPGFDLGSDLNAEPSCTENDKGADLNPNWETVGSGPMPENELQCQENSTNEDFDE